MIEPIGRNLQFLVEQKTLEYISLAGEVYQRRFPPVEVRHDLSGSSAGMFRVDRGHCLIRYNPWLFAKYFDENLAATVPHEVAHYIVHCLQGRRRIRPHGQEWQEVMAHFDADSAVTCNFDMADIPQRKHRRFDYTCSCRVHELSTRRHNNINRRGAIYQCVYCGSELKTALSANNSPER